MKRFMAYALLMYFIVLAMGMDFFFTGVSLGLLDAQLMAFGLITVIPGLFIAIYAVRERIRLENHERLLQWLIYVALGLAVVITVVFEVPVLYTW